MSKTIGDILKDLRLKKNITQDLISKQTNISKKKIDALERNYYSQFPGKFYYLSYIKEYLKVLNHDQDSFFKQYQDIIKSIHFRESNTQVKFSRITYSRFKRKKIVLFIVLFIVVMIVLTTLFFLVLKGKFDLKPILGDLTQALKR